MLDRLIRTSEATYTSVVYITRLTGESSRVVVPVVVVCSMQKFAFYARVPLPLKNEAADLQIVT